MFRKYIICLSTRRPLIYDHGLQTNGDNHENHKENRNKRGKTDSIQEKIKKTVPFKLKISRSGTRRWRTLFLKAPAWELTHSVSEWRFDDIRLSGISRAQISRIELLEPKWLLS